MTKNNDSNSKEQQLDIANAKINDVTPITAMLPTKKKNVIYGAIPKSIDLNPPIQSGFSFTFKEATAVNDAGQSFVTYIVDVHPVIIGTTPQEIIFTVSEFQSKVDAIIDANLRIKAVIDSTTTPPSKKKNVIYGAIPQAVDLNVPIQSGFSFTFKEATAVNGRGESIVTYIVDVHPVIIGTTPQEIIFTVSEFQSKADAIIDADLRIKAVIDSTTTPPSKKKNVIYGAIPKSIYLNVPIQSGFSFTFKEATAVNDVGQSFVTYMVDVHPVIIGTTPQEIIFVVGGFETKVITDANKKIQDVILDPLFLVESSYKPPTMKKMVNFGAIPKPIDFNSPILSGFSFTFKEATAVNGRGESIVTYIVDVDPKILGTTPEEKFSLVLGFQNLSDAIVDANKKIKDVSQSTILEQPSKKENVNHGVAPLENDLNPPIQNSFSFTFKEATAVNGAGQSFVTYIVNVDNVILAKKVEVKEITIIVKGFNG